MEYFRQLGESIRTTWQRTDFALADLPTIAADALANAWSGGDVPALDDVLQWLWMAEELPEQVDLDGKFGQPPITLYHCQEFHISILLWHTGTTSVHQHRFCGAFSVLHGASLQGRFRFHTTDPLDGRIKIGDLEALGFDLLTQGAIEPIVSGAGLIHSVFHLDAPSATLVIRNPADPDSGPQYDYRGRHVALDPFDKDPLLRRRLQCLDTLAMLDHDNYLAATEAILAHSDPLTCYRVLEHVALRSSPAGVPAGVANDSASESSQVGTVASRTPIPASALTDLLTRARVRHGAWIDKLPSVLSTVRRKRLVATRRALILDPDHRYFLALLGNLDRRADILRLVAARVPERDPRDTVMDWMRAMSGTDIVGLELDEANELIVRFLLEDTAPADIPARLAEVYDPDDIAAQSADLAEHIERIRTADIFQTLLGDAG